MPIHPLLHLAATRPHLLADHVEAYAELVDEEIGEAVSFWRRRALMNGIAAALVMIGIMLGGTALMLWMTVPPSGMRAVWGLIAVPATPVLIALLVLLLRQRAPSSMFANVKQQLAADFRMLRGRDAPQRVPTP